MSHGLQVQGAYTWSHAMDDGVDPLGEAVLRREVAKQRATTHPQRLGDVVDRGVLEPSLAEHLERRPADGPAGGSGEGARAAEKRSRTLGGGRRSKRLGDSREMATHRLLGRFRIVSRDRLHDLRVLGMGVPPARPGRSTVRY